VPGALYSIKTMTRDMCGRVAIIGMLQNAMPVSQFHNKSMDIGVLLI
jgi:hypothetical protein